jgi:hypothetical protein
LLSIEEQLLMVTTVFTQSVGFMIIDSVTDWAAIGTERLNRRPMIMAEVVR